MRAVEHPGGSASSPAERRIDPLRPLARAARGGDRIAQRELLRELGPSLLRVARGVLGARHRDLDDVVQDSMLSFMRALPSYREECSVKHFAARIAVRTAIDHLRHLSRLARADTNSFEAGAEAQADGADPAELAQHRALVVMLLDELSEVQAEALVLRAVLGCSIEEIAEASGVPGNTVRSRLRLAKQAIARRFEDEVELVPDEADGNPALPGRVR